MARPAAAAIIQARVGSTRLPRKVLLEIEGRSMLERVVERARRCRWLDEIIVATSNLGEDDAIAELCSQLRVPVVRGSSSDVLSRYLDAAATTVAQTLVRITSDCPLIDPELIDLAVRRFAAESVDYLSLAGYPRGLDVEVFSAAALVEAGRAARLPYERAHVTPYLYQRPEHVRALKIEAEPPLPAFRLTVDTADDLALVRAVYRALGPDGDFGYRDVCAFLSGHPEVAALNAHVRQKQLEEG